MSLQARFAKRAMDILGSFVIIVGFLPMILLVSLLIKTTSRGPILFRQERVGQFGRKFTMLKYRSMFHKCDSKSHQEFMEKYIKPQDRECQAHPGSDGQDPVYKEKNDPRITLVGRWLRKTSFDELPQLFNVLRGDMSLVGPRPPIAYEVECYDIWHRRRILEMKPGITGLWQVTGRSRTTFDELVRLDLRYTREWSVWLDIKILLMTPYVAITGKGGY
jgi:lipopolysaccharide/colanic/teichoic acid biosynthesis glycosyltransferase